MLPPLPEPESEPPVEEVPPPVVEPPVVEPPVVEPPVVEPPVVESPEAALALDSTMSLTLMNEAFFFSIFEERLFTSVRLRWREGQ